VGGDDMVVQHHHGPGQRAGKETYWFVVAIAIIIAFGFLLWLVLWLSNAEEPTSNDPNRQPHDISMVYSTVHDINQLGISG
jgi:hypothetical protein